MGDKVLSVNGTSVVDVDHYYAVEVLKASGPTLTLVVTRDSPTSTRYVITYNILSFFKLLINTSFLESLHFSYRSCTKVK